MGALSVTQRRDSGLTPVEEQLLADLAHQAGLVLRNLSLTAALMERVEELRASRVRLVTAQDTARRRLERNLHDGAQQHLVALKVKIGLAKSLARGDPARLEALLAELGSDADEALETLRDLARGIYPPLLADKGLPTALQAQLRKTGMQVELTADGVGRYRQEVEGAVYFCCLEALQNVSKYARAERVSLRLDDSGGTLTFAVEDDGAGFDADHVQRGAGLQNMIDRVEALGGTVAVASTPGQGTMVSGRVPLATRAG